MIWLRRDEAGSPQLEYYGPGGLFLTTILKLLRIKSLALRRGVFSGSNVSFLSQPKSLETLRIVDWKLRDAGAIEQLRGLKKLQLQTPGLEKPVDLRNFPELRELSADAADTVSFLEMCSHLERLFVGRLRKEALSDLNSLRKLKGAEFSEPGFCRIGPVDLPNLETLVLKATRKLEDWTGLERLVGLKTLWMFGVPHLRSLKPLQSLRGLEWLLLDNCGRVESLEPLAALPRLRQLNLVGNTRIMDGRVSILMNAPSLEEVSFPSRSSYDATEEKVKEGISSRRS